MKKKTNLINEIVETAKSKGISQLYTEDTTYNGKTITINGKQLTNFGSYSYIGLEIDDRLKEAAIEGIQRYGLQYPSSRAYVSSSLYKELEDLVSKMYNAPIVLTSSLTTGHHGVMPVVIEENDAIILDQRVHTSVQDAAKKLRSEGILVDSIRHNNMEELKAKVEELSKNHSKIWYACDGVYSMYGDCVPIEDVINLANHYKQLYLYVDDAHGMSAFGENGTGYVMSKVKLHPKMILATGMAKAFGTIGGIFIIPDEQLCNKVRNCTGPNIFSGQQSVPVLSASIASAKIHLSIEIIERQNDLAEKITYCHTLLKKYHLPDISDSTTPIFFIGLGQLGLGFNLVKRMMEEGFFTNLAAFPAVPEIHTGIRFTITTHLTYNDITRFVLALSKQFSLALLEEGRSMRDIQKAFKRVANLDHLVSFHESYEEAVEPDLITTYHKTIENIPAELWNKLLGDRGAFNWEALKLYEKIFSNNLLEEHNWSFHYFVISDAQDIPLVAAFFTMGRIKNDMLFSASVSLQTEQSRVENPYYQTCRAMLMGSVATEGNHLYINKSSKDWKKAVISLLKVIAITQEKEDAEILLLRDMNAEDVELNEILMNQGFLKSYLPDNHILKNLSQWQDSSSFLSLFNHRKRQYLKQKVFQNEDLFEVYISGGSVENLEHLYQLYRNVCSKSMEVNTFPLSLKYFATIAGDKNWEIIELRINSNESANKNTVAVMFCQKNESRYCPLFVGLDYTFQDYNIYPQILWQTILRAKQLNLGEVNLGFTASQNKQKFGATVFSQIAYVQMKDNFNLLQLSLLSNEITKVKKV